MVIITSSILISVKTFADAYWFWPSLSFLPGFISFSAGFWHSKKKKKIASLSHAFCTLPKKYREKCGPIEDQLASRKEKDLHGRGFLEEVGSSCSNLRGKKQVGGALVIWEPEKCFI